VREWLFCISLVIKSLTRALSINHLTMPDELINKIRQILYTLKSLLSSVAKQIQS
jgi:hypothetical protein